MSKSWLRYPVLIFVGLTLVEPMFGAAPDETARPNFVLIYADDLGLGDVGCYGATAVKTPHIDRLAKEGIRFTDAHSAVATCTPSRFAMLTGSYAWREKGTSIAKGDAPTIIEPGTTTIASVLQQSGYKCSVVGKWHLGLGAGDLDWNQEISPGPLDIGFDECFIIPATRDQVPTVYVENRRVHGLDATDPLYVSYGHDNTIHNGVSRIGSMTGGTSARWVDEDMADVLTGKACEFIDRNAAASTPFFLYFALHDIHVPRMPHQRFVGSTTMGPRGDAITQADWCVGQVLARLDALGIADDTLVIFSSDNGPVLDDGYLDEAAEKIGSHDPTAGYRGGKYSIFEAGTRVPMLARWPGVIAPEQVSGALVSQIDFAADFASIVGHTLRPNECIDSSEQVPALFGHDDRGRWFLVEQASTLAIRHEAWKYIEPAAGPAISTSTGIETGLNTSAQLYDLEADPSERNNLANKYPKKVTEMKKVLSLIMKEGEK